MEATIETNIGNSYIVKVWKMGWVIVSKHMYKSDAENVINAIQKGKTSKEVREFVGLQDQRCNELKLKYNQNWN